MRHGFDFGMKDRVVDALPRAAAPFDLNPHEAVGRVEAPLVERAIDLAIDGLEADAILLRNDSAFDAADDVLKYLLAPLGLRRAPTAGLLLK